MQYGLVDKYQCFRETNLLAEDGDVMFSEMLISTYYSALRHNPEEQHYYLHHHENIIFHMMLFAFIQKSEMHS
jgi:hypothetical protein